MPIAPDPLFDDFPFRTHFDRLDSLSASTISGLGSSWDLYLDGMQLLYDAYAAAATRLAIPFQDRKDAALITSSQAVNALTSAGVLLLRGDAVRSVICSRQGLEELLHYYACLNVDGVARRFLDGKTPSPGEVRKAIEAHPIIKKTYAFLSKPAHGGIENAWLMQGDGWLPLQTGTADVEGARVAATIAVHVTAIGLPLIVTGLGDPTEPWHRIWYDRHTAFMTIWRTQVAGQMAEMEGRADGADTESE